MTVHNGKEKNPTEATNNEESAQKSSFTIRALKKLISWSITLAICIVFYKFISGMQNEQKENFFRNSKSQAMASCNRNSECIAKVNKFFDDCIKDNYHSYRSGKYKRSYVLDLEGLNDCISNK